MTWTLHHGDWRSALADLEVDAIVTDPPYGARCHNADGARADGARADGARADGLAPNYSHFTPSDIAEFLASWSPRCRGWIVALSCSDLAPVWQDAFFAVGRYGFAPVPCVIRGMSVRLAGDGPSSWAVYACAGRPRSKPFSTWGTLDGAYSGPAQRGAGAGRGKPRWLANALIRDYTKPGDIVCDPFAGWGTTLASCIELGRNAVGSEIDLDAHTEAMRRLSRPRTGDMFAALETV